MTVSDVVLPDRRYLLDAAVSEHGDHPMTAVAIAKDLGLTTSDTVLTGQDLDKMTVDALSAKIKEVSVFARVSPKHKMIIIDARRPSMRSSR